MTSEVMEEVLTKGTAASARSLGFKLPAAGKTGTTNDYKDAWFVGLHQHVDLRCVGRDSISRLRLSLTATALLWRCRCGLRS